MNSNDNIECKQCGKYGYKWGRPKCMYCGCEIQNNAGLKERLKINKVKYDQAEKEHEALKKKLKKEKLKELLDHQK